MKKLWIFFILLPLFLFPAYLFAQSAKIVDIKGMVLIKKDMDSPWQKAKINILLGKEAELKTEKSSWCTLAFDEELKNILTIKENSHIRIENVKPGNIFLPEGRVFSLIQSLAKAEKFQIRTPTAIAGSRGTGWATGYQAGNTSNSCFDDQIFIQGLDNQGNVTEEDTLSSGNGMNIGEGGVLGDKFALGNKDYAEWNDFMDYIDGLRGEGEEETDETGYLEGLRDDQRDDFSDIWGEGERRNRETTTGGTGGRVYTQ